MDALELPVTPPVRLTIPSVIGGPLPAGCGAGSAAS